MRRNQAEPEHTRASRSMAAAINLALSGAVTDAPVVILFGEDIGTGGDVFRINEGLLDASDIQRIIDIPAADTGIAGLCIGTAMDDVHPIFELQPMIASPGALKAPVGDCRWRVQRDLSTQIRAGFTAVTGTSEPAGRRLGKAPWYVRMSAIQVIVPSAPCNTGALLVDAIRDPDPVICMEIQPIFRRFSALPGSQQKLWYQDQARTMRQGNDLTIVTHDAMTARVLSAAARLARENGIEADVIDLMSIAPQGHKDLVDSARRTGHVLIVHEANRSHGPGGEIVASFAAEAFRHLPVPVRRVAGLGMCPPHFTSRHAHLPDVERILEAARGLFAQHDWTHAGAGRAA